MSAAPRRVAPATSPAPEGEEPGRGSEPPIRLRYGGAEVALRGFSAVYMVALAAVVGFSAPHVSAWLGAMERATASLDAVSTTLRAVADEVHQARQGVDRLGASQEQLDRRLGQIETDVSAVRAEVKASCGRR